MANTKAKRIVYTAGVWDLFHIGHLRFLEKCKALGDYLIVAVLTDEAAALYKRKPIIPFEERIEIVRAISCVDEAIPKLDLDTVGQLQRLGNVDVITHGDEQVGEFLGQAYMKSIGKEAIKLPYYPYQSSTKIIAEIKKLDYGS